MKLAVKFDWTKLMTPVTYFVEMTPRGGRIVVTPDKLETKWSQIAQGSDSNICRELRQKAYEFMIPFFETHGLYSPRQIADSTNIYLSHCGGDPLASTAEIFECSPRDVLKMDFLRTHPDGRYDHNHGFVPKVFLENCAKIKQLMASSGRPAEYVLHGHSPGAETLFTNEEFVTLFSLYVVPVSKYFYNECFYNPLEVTRAGLS